MIYMGVVLQKTLGSRKSQEIRQRIIRHIYLWEDGYHAALLADIIAKIRSLITRSASVSEETESRVFN